MEDTVAGHPQAYRTLGHKWPDNTITWSFADLAINSDPRDDYIGGTFPSDDSDGMRSLVRDAFDAWEAVCGVDFVEVRDSADSDVRIGWTAPAHSDGEGGTLAFYLPWTWTGTSTTSWGLIAFDHADSGLAHEDIYDTVLHEVGHALGLAHSDVANVVMSGGLYSGGGPTPYWGGVPGRDPLQPDDIAGAVALWGTADGGSSPPPSGGATGGDDTLVGTEGPDTLEGLGGNDAMLGGAGNDWLVGGPGDDRMWGQSGDDTLIGGSGSDLMFGLDGDDYAEGGSHRDIFLGGGGNDDLRGEGGDDGLWGEAGRDTIDGGIGADFVAGGTGGDSLRGGPGNDYLAGEEGDDVLNGDGGYDVLAGGSGDDTLHGSAEGDTFFGQEGADRFVLQGGTSWIMDFEPGIDRIEIPGMDEAGFRAAATQVGDHLHVAFEGGDPGSTPAGAGLYLAWTTLAGLEEVDLLA